MFSGEKPHVRPLVIKVVTLVRSIIYGECGRVSPIGSSVEPSIEEGGGVPIVVARDATFSQKPESSMASSSGTARK